MRKQLLLLSLVLLTAGAVFGDQPIADRPDLSSKILQDPKTKVVYYVESDRRHVAAISSEGKLLWCCEVLGTTAYKGSYVASIRFRDNVVVDVCYVGPGVGYGYINRRTGVFTATGMD